MPPTVAALLPIAAAIYAVMSGVTFIAYVLDKRAAGAGGRRWSEASLHALEMLGGWPGALVAQHLVRHKNAKAAYQMVFWLVVAVHVAGWAIVARYAG